MLPRLIRPIFPRNGAAQFSTAPAPHFAVWSGLPIEIEHPIGSVREGTSKTGKKWRTVMKADYGHIKRTRGADNEHIDVYIGPVHQPLFVHVVHQVNPDTGKYDEDKVMIGFEDAEAARTMYLKHYDRKEFFGSMTTIPTSTFLEAVAGTGKSAFRWKSDRAQGSRLAPLTGVRFSAPALFRFDAEFEQKHPRAQPHSNQQPGSFVKSSQTEAVHARADKAMKKLDIQDRGAVPKLHRLRSKAKQNKPDAWTPEHYIHVGDEKDRETLRGRILEKKDLKHVPMYHVSGRMNEIADSGILLGRSTDSEGGFGGGSGGEGVSLTTNIHDAMLLKRELVRLHKLSNAKDEAEAKALIQSFAERDNQKHPESGTKAMKSIQPFLDTNGPSARERGRIVNLYVEAYKGQYQYARETAGGDKNPVIYGRIESFKKIDPNGIGVVRVDAEDIPDDALIRTGSDKHLGEVRVHSDIPLKRSKILSGAQHFGAPRLVNFDAAFEEKVHRAKTKPGTNAGSFAPKHQVSKEQLTEHLRTIKHPKLIDPDPAKVQAARKEAAEIKAIKAKDRDMHQKARLKAIAEFLEKSLPPAVQKMIAERDALGKKAKTDGLTDAEKGRLWKLHEDIARARLRPGDPKMKIGYNPFDVQEMPAGHYGWYTRKPGKIDPVRFIKIDKNSPPKEFMAGIAAGEYPAFQPTMTNIMVAEDFGRESGTAYIYTQLGTGIVRPVATTEVSNRNTKKKWEMVRRLLKLGGAPARHFHDQAAKGDPRALATYLILKSGLRIGSKKGDTLGVIDLQGRHVTPLDNGDVRIQFRGKKGIINTRILSSDDRWDTTHLEEGADRAWEARQQGREPEPADANDARKRWEILRDMAADNIIYAPKLKQMIAQQAKKVGEEGRLFDGSSYVGKDDGIMPYMRGEMKKLGMEEPERLKMHNFRHAFSAGGFKDMAKAYFGAHGLPTDYKDYLFALGGTYKVDEKTTIAGGRKGKERFFIKRRATVPGLTKKESSRYPGHYGLAMLGAHRISDARSAFEKSYTDPEIIAAAKKAIGATWKHLIPTTAELQTYLETHG